MTIDDCSRGKLPKSTETQNKIIIDTRALRGVLQKFKNTDQNMAPTMEISSFETIFKQRSYVKIYFKSNHNVQGAKLLVYYGPLHHLFAQKRTK